MKIVSPSSVFQPSRENSAPTQSSSAALDRSAPADLYTPIREGAQTPLFSDLPDPKLAVTKLRAMAQHADGVAATILDRAAAAAARTAAQPEARTIALPREVLKTMGRSQKGTIERRGVVNADGSLGVELSFVAGFSNRRLKLSPESMRGVPNGARARYRANKESAAPQIQLDGHDQLHNMVGRVVSQGGKLVLQALSPLSPLSELSLVDQDPQLLGQTVIVDVQHKANGSFVGIVHDAIEPGSPERTKALAVALDAGIQGTHSPEVLAETQAVLSAVQKIEVKPGFRDFRDKAMLATDNPGRGGEYRSQDPEQISYVERRPGGGYYMYDALADRRWSIPEGGALDALFHERVFTFYGPGFNLPALPQSLSEGLAVFLEGEDRYATVVKVAFDEQGEQIPDETEVFRAVVNNRWAGSYREAEWYYRAKAGDQSFEALQPQLDDASKAQLDLFGELGQKLEDAAAKRGAILRKDDGRYLAERCREQFSCNVGIALGGILETAEVAGVYRIQAASAPKKIEAFAALCEEVGRPWEQNKESIWEFISKLDSEDPLRKTLVSRAFRTMHGARYSTELGGHFALGTTKYAQGTASNRRGTDLANLAQTLSVSSNEDPVFEIEELKALADLANREQKQIRRNAGAKVQRLQQLSELKPYEGQRVEAVVRDIEAMSITFEVTEANAQVKLHVRELAAAFGEKFDALGSNSAMQSRDGRCTFKLGQSVSLNIERVDAEFMMLEASPAQWPQSDAAKG